MPLITLHTILLSCCAMLLCFAALHDVVARTIPNRVPAALGFIALVLLFSTPDASHRLLVGMAAFFGLFGVALLFWRLGCFGGGDAKLLGAVGLLVPPGRIGGAVTAIGLAGGMLALPYLACRGRLARPASTRPSGLLARALRAERFRLRRGGPVPYAVAIAVGAIFGLLGGLMIVRIALFVLMAFGLLGFGVVAWVYTHPAIDPASQPVQVAVLTLSRAINAGNLLKSEDLANKELSQAETPEGALTDKPDVRRDLIGGMVRHSLSAGDVLRAADVMRPGDHGFLAAVLQPGMRAVTVGVDAVSGTAGLIWPGDRVDVILTQSMDEQGLPAARRVAAETVLQNVRVIAIDRLLVEGAVAGAPEPEGARTVTLEVTEEQAERVQVAGRIGRLSLTVRSAEQPVVQTIHVDTPPIWAGDVSRALLGDSKATTSVMRLYQGTSDGKEFRF